MQRVRKALEPPGEARDDMWIIAELARRLGHDWAEPTAEEVWDELRSLSPMHAGMSYDRLEEHRRHPVAVPRREPPRLADPARAAVGGAARGPAGAVLGRRGQAAVRGARRRVPDPAHDRPTARVVQHRRADEPLQLAAPPRRVAAISRRRTPSGSILEEGEIVRVSIASRLGRGAAAHRPARCVPDSRS